MKKSILVILLCLMFFAVMPVMSQGYGGEPSKGFTLQVYTDLEIKPKTQIPLELNYEITKLSPTVQGGENITVNFYSNDILVGCIDNGAVIYAVDFLPGNVYATITGQPGDRFDVTFNFD